MGGTIPFQFLLSLLLPFRHIFDFRRVSEVRRKKGSSQQILLTPRGRSLHKCGCLLPVNPTTPIPRHHAAAVVLPTTAAGQPPATEKLYAVCYTPTPLLDQVARSLLAESTPSKWRYAEFMHNEGGEGAKGDGNCDYHAGKAKNFQCLLCYIKKTTQHSY